ncbi:MAG: pentapeptide repeat-containing protein, partial [Pseudanabaenales cyanobacterium]|nr:pentapeptide repeat-containing protein [Pseudanabaenales cyanobacterium]
SKGEDFSPLFDVLEQMGIKPFGVHASLGVFRGDSSSPRRLRVRLKGNFKDQNREKVKALLLEIQWLANNSYGRISSINPESIEIELEGPEDALEGLKRLIDSDELTKISELQIQDALFVKAEVRAKRLNLQFADLTEVRLVGVRLVGARLVGANLTNADLTEANLYGADLTNARLIGARLNQAELTSANLTGANLEEARLTNANLSEANLIGANLVSTNYYGANLTRANLKATRLDRANLKETRLRFANLTGANLTVVDLERASLTGAKLIGANLYWANLKGADLEGVDLEGADLEGANLTRANLSRAKLGGANLTEARLDGAIVESATFTANLGLLEQDKTDLSQRGAIFGDVVKMRSSLDYKGVEPADDRIYLLPCLHQSHFIPRRLMS